MSNVSKPNVSKSNVSKSKTKIIINGEEHEIEEEESLLPLCEEEGIPFGCTEGVCGTCLITVHRGNECLNELTKAEKAFFSQGDSTPSGTHALTKERVERLACQCRCKCKGGVIEIED